MRAKVSEPFAYHAAGDFFDSISMPVCTCIAYRASVYFNQVYKTDTFVQTVVSPHKGIMLCIVIP